MISIFQKRKLAQGHILLECGAAEIFHSTLNPNVKHLMTKKI